jgi:hypothetical protein
MISFPQRKDVVYLDPALPYGVAPVGSLFLDENVILSGKFIRISPIQILPLQLPHGVNHYNPGNRI